MDDFFKSNFEAGSTYIVAVSGGVDSVVLLDKMSKIKQLNLIVSHFDHQIRGQDSTRDAELVRQLAKKYDLPYQLRCGGLGADASEEQARAARYQFLRQLAAENQAKIVVAHHFDDVIETIAINLERGTGWQGLAVMDAPDIIRPLINRTKAELIDYANKQQLTWHEDQTNYSDKYLRNRLRRKLEKIPAENRLLVFDYFWRQKALKRAIFAQAQPFFRSNRRYQRYFWIMIDFDLAVELLRIIIKLHFDQSITIPQAKQAILAIKTNQPNTVHQITNGIELEFEAKQFVING